MAMKRFAISYDGGNWGLKCVLGPGQIGLHGAGRALVRHAFAPLTETDWHRAVDAGRRGQFTRQIVRVNGLPYAFGDAALRHSYTIKQGAARYHKGYADILLCGTLFALLHGRSGRMSVNLIASHSPRDVQYASNLEAALQGEYQLEGVDGCRMELSVDVVMTIDEGLGALFNHLLLPNLAERRHTPVKAGSSVVIDAGGFTTDFAAIDVEAGRPVIDTSALSSVTVGTWSLYDRLEDHLRVTYADLLQQQPQSLSFRLLDEALRTGYYRAGRHLLDVENWVKQEMTALVNIVRDAAYRHMGGLLNYQTILLAGGGAALLYPYLQAAFASTHELVLAEDDRDALLYANAQGALKLYQRLGGA